MPDLSTFRASDVSDIVCDIPGSSYLIRGRCIPLLLPVSGSSPPVLIPRRNLPD